MLSEIERFVNWVRRRNPTARTWRDYGYDLRFFVQVVGDRSPREITFRDVDKFISQQSEQGFKPSTINCRLAAILALYSLSSCTAMRRSKRTSSAPNCNMRASGSA